MNKTPILFAAAVFAVCSIVSANQMPPLQFDFGAGSAKPGHVQINADTLYTPERGYGLVNAEGVRAAQASNNGGVTAGSLVSDAPFFFEVNLPEGNYDITIRFGHPSETSDTTVKAESRRLMLESIKTKRGEWVSRTFTVNVRTPRINDSKQVVLKPREVGSLHWDEKLTLEFNGPKPAVAGVEIKRNDSALTIYLAGDSTVTDQRNEPWSAWGQMLPRFLSAGTAVANHAESGLSLGSFRSSTRLEKILSTIKPGDYVFIQFGHNDMKEKNSGAFTTYAKNLRSYIEAIAEKQGTPVLVTPMYRRRFTGNTLTDSLGDYPKAVRQVAEEKKVPCIDLHAMSARLFTALGPEKTKKAFVFFAANTYPNQPKALADNTHFSTYGAYELARCMVEGIRANVPELATHLASDVGHYNPDRPDDFVTFSVPASLPSGDMRIPDGDGRKQENTQSKPKQKQQNQ